MINDTFDMTCICIRHDNQGNGSGMLFMTCMHGRLAVATYRYNHNEHDMDSIGTGSLLAILDMRYDSYDERYGIHVLNINEATEVIDIGQSNYRISNTTCSEASKRNMENVCRETSTFWKNLEHSTRSSILDRLTDMVHQVQSGNLIDFDDVSQDISTILCGNHT